MNQVRQAPINNVTLIRTYSNVKRWIPQSPYAKNRMYDGVVIGHNPITPTRSSRLIYNNTKEIIGTKRCPTS
jgi:hypothetical protein